MREGPASPHARSPVVRTSPRTRGSARLRDYIRRSTTCCKTAGGAEAAARELLRQMRSVQEQALTQPMVHRMRSVQVRALYPAVVGELLHQMRSAQVRVQPMVPLGLRSDRG